MLWVPAVARREWSDLRVSERSTTAALYLLLMGSIVVFGTIVLREPFSARIAVACAVVLAGTAIVRSTEAKANVSAPATQRAGPRPASPGRG